MRIFKKKYYYKNDYEANCKHKTDGQYSLSCRKRKDGTLIGSPTCKFRCKHAMGFGTDKKGQWIRCKYLKEAM